MGARTAQTMGVRVACSFDCIDNSPRQPLAEEVDACYDPQREELRVADYKIDMALIQLK